MKAMKFNILVWTFALLFAVNAFAQFDDEFGDEQQQTEESCVPKNLKTKWDSLATKNLDQDIRLLYNFGYEYYKNKSYKEAMPYLWEVFLRDKGKYARASIRKIAEIYYNQGMVDSTLIACQRGLDLFPDMLILHHYAGLLQRQLGKFRCAIPHFEALVKKDSTSIVYLQTLAFLYFKNDDERAIDVQEKVVELEPNNAEAENTLATYVNYFIGEGADIDIRRAAWEKDKTNIELAQKYGEVAARSGHFKEALDPLKVVLDKKPSKKLYVTRAEVYENLNDFSKAIGDYKSALKLGGEDANIMLRISVDYRNQNSFSKAAYWINKALKAKPHYGLAYITLGETYEASVSYCQKKRGGKSKYEDKLVYLKAYNIYAKAKKDPAFVAKAKKKMVNVLPFIPTKEDSFMHKHAKIESACYKWLK